MRTVVCVKHTPDSEARLSVLDDGAIDWGDSPLILNPWDEYAVEEALLLREVHGGTVTALSMGDEGALEALKQAVAMGCDEAVRVWDEGCAGSDSLATSRVLACAIERLGDVDLVLFGRSAIDGDSWQTGPAVARRLGFAFLAYVIRIQELDPQGGAIIVQRLLEQGRETVAATLPAVVGTTKGINEPRYTSFRGIRKAARMDYPCWSLSDLDLSPEQAGSGGSAVRWPDVFAPPPRGTQAQMLAGPSPDAVASLLVERLMADKVL
jgi:electron transfer flavoprotein beta subunit